MKEALCAPQRRIRKKSIVYRRMTRKTHTVYKRKLNPQTGKQCFDFEHTRVISLSRRAYKVSLSLVQNSTSWAILALFSFFFFLHFFTKKNIRNIYCYVKNQFSNFFKCTNFYIPKMYSQCVWKWTKNKIENSFVQWLSLFYEKN